MGLEQRTAIVTGSAHGIGRAIALRLAAEGARLVLNDVDEEGLGEVVLKIKGLGWQVAAVRASAMLPSDVNRLMGDAVDTFGQIDILVNNVGGSRGPRHLGDITETDFKDVINLNLWSTFLCTQAVVPYMERSGGGRIVNLASVAARCGSPVGSPIYAASKAAVIGLTRHLAGELAPLGITVNCVAPGVTLSERMVGRLDEWTERDREDLLRRIPMHRLASVDEVAGAVAFLCSDSASYITGATVDVNGGLYFG